MSITKKVELAIQYYTEEDYEESFSQVMVAADASAKKMFGTVNKGNKIRMTSFFHEYMDVITKIGTTMISVKNLSFVGDKDEDKMTFEEVLYKFIRCDLLHEAEISDKIKFSEGTFGFGDGKYIMPPSIAIGLCMAVVICEKNRKLWNRKNLSFTFHGKQIEINRYWGRPELFRKTIGLGSAV
jgi:hypothetical protein